MGFRRALKMHTSNENVSLSKRALDLHILIIPDDLGSYAVLKGGPSLLYELVIETSKELFSGTGGTTTPRFIGRKGLVQP